MMPQVNESDWKLFRSLLPEWQERHMEGLIRDYAVLLPVPGRHPTNSGRWKSESGRISGMWVLWPE